MSNPFEVNLNMAPIEQSSPSATVPTEQPTWRDEDSLQEKIRKSGAKIVTESRSGNPEEPASVKSSAQYLQEIQQLSEDPEFQRGAPPDTRQSLQEALQFAKEKYEKQATKNEWLEVAQLLGRAVAQYGAAREGMRTGHNLSNLNLGSGIDYEARTGRAQRDYLEEVKQAGSKADDKRTQWLDKSTERKEEYSKRRDYLSDALRTAREAENDRERNRTGTNQERREEIAELNRRETELRKQLKFRQTLVNQLSQEDDLSSKSQNRLEEKYGAVAAGGDIDLNQLRSELEAADKEGRFWGKNPDATARQGVFKQKTDELNNMLAAIQKRKRELGVDKLPIGEQKSTSKDTSPKVFTPARLSTYAKQYNMSEEAARSHLESQGYSFSN